MNCFYHSTTAAVGICKSCGKGLCPSCAADLGKGLACKGRCEEDVMDLIRIIDRSIQRSPLNEEILNTARSNRYLGAIFYLAFGFIFIAFAIYQYLQAGLEGPAPFLGAVGICFLIFGLIGFQRAMRFSRKSK